MLKETQARLATCLTLVTLAACMSTGQAPVGQPAPELRMDAAASHRGDIVDHDELLAVQEVASAYDALQRLRPEFLLRRATAMPTDPYEGFPVVYVDGRWLGRLSTLQSIPIAAIAEIRYLRSGPARSQFGKSFPGGVIAVSTQR